MKQVDGTILLEKINLDFCFVYLLNNNVKICVCYVYSFAVYNGYLILPKQNDFNELSIMICYEGDMIYETDE